MKRRMKGGRWSASITCLFLISFMLLCPYVRAGEPSLATQEVVAEGRVVVGDDMTLAQAKALSLNDARRVAIERAAGVLVRGTTIVYNAELISDLIAAFSRGLIVKEEVLAEGPRTEAGYVVYVSRIRALVKPLEQKTRKDIRILSAEVLSADHPVPSSHPFFQDQDEVRIRVLAEGDLTLHIFSVSQDGHVNRLLPNAYVPCKQISAREEVMFPDDALRTTGFKLRVHVPSGLSRAYETIIVIATKERVDLLAGKREAVLSDLMGELSCIEQSSWTDAVIGYEVRR